MFVNKLNIKTKELFEECPIEFLKDIFDKSTYPWEILPQIKEVIKKQIELGVPGYTEI